VLRGVHAHPDVRRRDGAIIFCVHSNKMPTRSNKAKRSARRRGGKAKAKEESPAASAKSEASTDSTASGSTGGSPKKPTQAQMYNDVLKARISGLQATMKDQLKEVPRLPAKSMSRSVKGLPTFKAAITALQMAAVSQAATVRKVRADIETDPYDLLVKDINAPAGSNAFVPAFAKNLKELIKDKAAKYEELLGSLKVSLGELERQQSLLTKVERDESPDRYRIVALKSAIARLNELSLTAKAYSDIFFPSATAKETSEILSIRDQTAGRADATPTQAWDALVTARLKWVLKSSSGFGGLTSKAQQSVRGALAKLIRSLARGFSVFQRKYYNMVLMGPAGIGKTRLARIIGFIMSNLLILFNSRVIELSASSFTAEFEGQTGAKTLSLLMNGLESVIFLDEAYNLPRCNPAGGPPPSGANFGAEAITEIVQFMSTYKGMYMMIVAGYEAPMKECFLVSNEGFARRFDPSYRIVLPRYGVEDMLLIFKANLAKELPDLTPLERALLSDVLIRPDTGLVALGLFPSNASDIEALVSELVSAVSNQYDAFSETPAARDIERALKRLYVLAQGLSDYTLSRGVAVELRGVSGDPAEEFGFVTQRIKSETRPRAA
jgi:flagellar biosynthesis GTPase FlhF